MVKGKAGGWIAATVVAALVLVAGAWFLAISPVMASAAEAREATQSQLDQNTIAKRKVDQLKAQFAKIDELRADLGTLQAQVPTSDQLAAYRREISALAQARQVTVLSFTVGTATEVASSTPPPAAPAATDTSTDTSTDTAETDTATTPPAATEPAAPSAFGIPVIVEVVGPYDAVLTFLQDVQQGTQRLNLVLKLNASVPAPGPAAAGKPQIPEGFLQLQIGGAVFVAPETTAATPDPTGTATPAPLPAPNGRNPVLPLP